MNNVPLCTFASRMMCVSREVLPDSTGHVYTCIKTLDLQFSVGACDVFARSPEAPVKYSLTQHHTDLRGHTMTKQLRSDGADFWGGGAVNEEYHEEDSKRAALFGSVLRGLRRKWLLLLNNSGRPFSTAVISRR